MPQENPLLRQATALRIPVLSEIELAARFVRAPLLAVTGTNGKSTTTTLIGAMIQAAGKKVFVGGNLGVPFISAAAEDWDWGGLGDQQFSIGVDRTVSPADRRHA